MYVDINFDFTYNYQSYFSDTTEERTRTGYQDNFRVNMTKEDGEWIVSSFY